MDNKRARELRQKALVNAMSKKFFQEADDIAQDVVESFLRRGPGQSVDQAVIDSIRSMLGRGEFAKVRQKIDRSEITLDNTKFASVQPPRDGLDFEALLSKLPRLESVTLKLFHEWGFTQKEIGDLFGVTESCISQWMIRAHNRLKEHLEPIQRLSAVTKVTKRSR